MRRGDRSRVAGNAPRHAALGLELKRVSKRGRAAAKVLNTEEADVAKGTDVGSGDEPVVDAGPTDQSAATQAMDGQRRGGRESLLKIRIVVVAENIDRR